MTEAGLRTRFDREISAPDKELLWRELKKRRYVTDMCSGELEWKDFEAEAQSLGEYQRQILGRTKPPGRTPNLLPYIDVRLTDLEAEHAATLVPYLAKRAALLPEVRNFREDKLNGGTLEPEYEQIAAFLRSELTYLSSEQYADLEWALEQVPSYLDADEVEELRDLLGGWQNRAPQSQDEHWSENFRRAVELDSMAMSYVPSRQFLYGLMHLIHDESGSTLEDVGRWLITLYPWPLRDAAWFVLTGEPPEIESLKVQYDRARGTYSLTFAPWISEKTIRLAYRSVQPRDNRPLSKKGLSAFRFVNEHTEPGQTPKWAELTRLWNEQHPEDKFTDRSALRQAYERAKERLASPWEKKWEHLGERDDVPTEVPEWPL